MKWNRLLILGSAAILSIGLVAWFTGHQHETVSSEISLAVDPSIPGATTGDSPGKPAPRIRSNSPSNSTSSRVAPHTAPTRAQGKNPLAVDKHPTGDALRPEATATAFAAQLKPASNSSRPHSKTPIPVAFDLGPGVRAPIAFLEPERELTRPQQAALDAIRKDFAKEMAVIASTLPQAAETEGNEPGVLLVGGEVADPAHPTELEVAWVEAKRRADDRYRLLFGVDAFNRQSLKAAQEALKSK